MPQPIPLGTYLPSSDGGSVQYDNIRHLTGTLKLSAPALLCWLGYLDVEHLRASERQRGLCSLGVRSISSARSDCAGSPHSTVPRAQIIDT